jgi:nucleotide-binding universal stress UspA family protein
MFDRILVAIDASEPSARAVTFAQDLAQDRGSEIVVLHAIPRWVSRHGTAEIEVPEESKELVDRTVRDLKDAGANARGELIRVLEGHVSRGIVETAANVGADAIVLGTRGRSDFGGLFIGSVTHRVLHLAEVPVIVVP